MSLDHVHPPTMAGICGSKIDGARSVVLAGEYDDEDHGETLYAITLIVCAEAQLIFEKRLHW